MAVLPYIDTYDPFSGIVMEGTDMINVTHGHYPCDLNQRFKRAADGAIIQLKDWEWHPVVEKVISGVVMVEMESGKQGKANILYFLNKLKTRELKFYSPESKKKYY